MDIAKELDIKKNGYLCHEFLKHYYQMKNNNTDSTANISRFARDKRQRVSSTERVERTPRPRREADNEGHREFRPRVAKTEKTPRASYNPHFTRDNRLRPEYEQRPEGARGERPRRNNDGERGGYNRNERTERGGYNRNERSANGRHEGGFKPKSGGRPNDNRGGFKAGGKRPAAPKHDDKPRSYPKYNPNKQVGEMRLNRFIAQSGICSRREADDFIAAGVVSVNGKVVTELGTKVLRSDSVVFHNTPVTMEKKVYILLNKPKDTVTTVDDPQQRKTVMDLIKGACRERVYPVGRLDRNTTGVLLLTNDGELATKLTHPQWRKKKIYHVFLNKNVSPEDIKRIAEGIELEDGPIRADAVEYASPTDKKQVGIEIHSGRNRIVRRIFESLGYKVTKLDRVLFAGLTKKNVRRGDWRFLTEAEVNMLRMGAFE